jgi:Fe-S-cluster-containing dehydrogenase component
MSVSRRNFLKLTGGGALVGTAADTAQARPNKEPLPNAVGMLYDATLCIGCKACMVGCKQANGMPIETTLQQPMWDSPPDISDKTLNNIKVYRHGSAEVKDREIDGFSFVKRHCMHCVDAVCVSVCPVNAMRKDHETGVVTHHPEVCIGCRYCVFACPYNVPAYEFDNPLGQIQKCQFCDHRLKEGKLPGCVETCPTGASLFGTREEVLAEAQRRLAMRPGEEYEFPMNTVNSPHRHVAKIKEYQNHIFGEKEGGGTQVFMLAGVPFAKLGMPELPEKSAASRSEGVQHTLYKGLALPLLLFAGLLYATRKTVGKGHDDGHGEQPAESKDQGWKAP